MAVWLLVVVTPRATTLPLCGHLRPVPNGPKMAAYTRIQLALAESKFPLFISPSENDIIVTRLNLTEASFVRRAKVGEWRAGRPLLILLPTPTTSPARPVHPPP